MGRTRIVLEFDRLLAARLMGVDPASNKLGASTGQGPTMPSLRQIRLATGLVPPRA